MGVPQSTTRRNPGPILTTLHARFVACKKEMSRWFLLAGGILAGASVVAGAFGAHALRRAWQALSDGELRALWWKLASDYMLAHAIALLVLGTLLHSAHGTYPSPWLVRGGYGWFAGIIVFSGSLYIMALTGQRWLGMVTPVGGSLLIAGWAMFVVAIAGRVANGKV
jgi:uncharacterized membrane protein YgdD (TMEM256/DUF423 family)